MSHHVGDNKHLTTPHDLFQHVPNRQNETIWKQKPVEGKKNVHDSPQFDTGRKTELQTPALQGKFRLNMTDSYTR